MNKVNTRFKKGHKHSEETKKKIGLKSLGRKQSEESIKKMLNSKAGYKHSEETKKKIGAAHMGSKRSQETKNKMSQQRKGRVLTKEWKLKIGESGKGKGLKENNPNWKGGITPINITIRQSIEYSLWREAVLARDNWTCQRYGTKGGKLQVHHIKNFSQYPELRFAIDNGITLSKKAHKEFHKKYGIKNNTPEQLKEFLNLGSTMII